MDVLLRRADRAGAWVAEMTRPAQRRAAETRRYGLGFWLHATTDTVILVGYDAGVSFSSFHDPHDDVTATVISNWPTARGASRASSTSASGGWGELEEGG